MVLGADYFLARDYISRSEAGRAAPAKRRTADIVGHPQPVS